MTIKHLHKDSLSQSRYRNLIYYYVTRSYISIKLKVYLVPSNLINFNSSCHFSFDFEFKMLLRSAVLISLAFVCQAALLPNQTGPVLVELYYESLCPYCKEFINDQLFPTFTKLANTGDHSIRLFRFAF